MYFTAPLFIPNKQKKYSPLFILMYFLAAVFFILLFYVIHTGGYNQIMPIIAPIFFLLLIIGFIKGSKHEDLNGTFEGNLLIDDTKVVLGNKTLGYNEIDNLDFHISYYYGQPVYESIGGRVLPSYLSQGTKNQIQVNSKSGEKAVAYFKLNNKEHREELLMLLKDLTLKGVLPLYRTAYLLQMPYRETEELKKQIQSLSGRATNNNFVN